MSRWLLTTFAGAVEVELIDGKLEVRGPSAAATYVRQDIARCSGASGQPLVGTISEADLEVAVRSEWLAPYAPRPA